MHGIVLVSRCAGEISSDWLQRRVNPFRCGLFGNWYECTAIRGARMIVPEGAMYIHAQGLVPCIRAVSVIW